MTEELKANAKLICANIYMLQALKLTKKTLSAAVEMDIIEIQDPQDDWSMLIDDVDFALEQAGQLGT